MAVKKWNTNFRLKYSVRKSGLPFQMFRFSQKFSAGATKNVGFCLLSNWIFRKLCVNGKLPKAHKLAVFPGLAITSSVIPPTNNAQLLKSHLLFLFRRVLFFSAFFSCLCCSSSLTALFLVILFMSATRTMYKSKSLPMKTFYG